MKMRQKRLYKFTTYFMTLLLAFMFIGIKPVFAETNTKNAKIITGPYLLAPKTNGMTVSWETDMPVEAYLWYGIGGKLDNKIEVKCERGTPFGENTEGICMYRGVLKNLKPNTLYNYKVELKSGQVEEGTFKTLSQNPADMKIMTISDSHQFISSDTFSQRVLKERPDFILHTGDMLIGTGYQKDQFNLWFGKGAEFLKHIPVVYACGNHDDGPYFDDYFTYAQKNAYNSDSTGRNFSFNYGNIHVTMINSNPWGLYEMNAVTGGFEVDEKTKKEIENTLKWVEKDLKSDDAKKATWRIVGVHHPYTDDFTQKHLVDILEKYNANLTLAGHLHVYYGNVSLDPKVGAKSVFIAQGDGRKVNASMEYGKADERLLPDFPEVFAQGQTDYSMLKIEGDKLAYSTYGDKDEKALGSVILSAKESKVSFSNVAVSLEKTSDSNSIKIEATVKNEGEGIATVLLNVLDNKINRSVYLFGEEGKERVVVLKPGETRNIKAKLPIYTPGKHVVKVGKVEKQLDFLAIPAAFKYSNIKMNLGKGLEADTVLVTADVKNVGNKAGEKNVNLFVDGKVVDTKKVKLKALETKSIILFHKFSQSGTYKVRIENMRDEVIDIEGTLKGIPIVKDLSGNGNHGLLRGAPKIINTESGKAVDLDGVDDYIEILDSKTLHTNDGLTGMVFANVDRLAKDDEKDHNPLFVKGPSVGWGTNYLMRMALRRSGALTSGVCYGINEGFWDSKENTVPVGKWAQYTAAFDTETGGITYINSEKVAEVAGISDHPTIRNWNGYPIFIGYSYMGHVIQDIGRAKYNTILDAKIGQVRFYRTKLTAEENKYIAEHPNEIGPRSKDLAVWLNFKDIETKGIHKTEWRKLSGKQLWNWKTLSIDSKAPGTASIKATIEVSDDGEKVKDSKVVTLKGGQEKIDISDLEKAQYIRIVTEFNSSITLNGTYTPELNEYRVAASTDDTNTEIVWNTRADWEKGSFEGAMGFEPLGRFKNYEEDGHKY
ncbi:metallophosphoesterase [Clostridium ganghwense]|uniref:Metallophosphoesterase n=1 Tax=Clostridium ganghwense TaxID=312089 RepID=A0ABT4CNC2_9CLOT|nr:metallophosphoesterase [Clostridium ganghwense]MCY6369494.1 metallophosphoesterase [Clostridium ganghwense]